MIWFKIFLENCLKIFFDVYFIFFFVKYCIKKLCNCFLYLINNIKNKNFILVCSILDFFRFVLSWDVGDMIVLLFDWYCMRCFLVIDIIVFYFFVYFFIIVGIVCML